MLAGDLGGNYTVEEVFGSWLSALDQYADDIEPLKSSFMKIWKANALVTPPEKLYNLSHHKGEASFGQMLQLFFLQYEEEDKRLQTLKNAIVAAYNEMQPDLGHGETWLEHVLALRNYPDATGSYETAEFLLNIADKLTMDLPTADMDAYYYFHRIWLRISRALSGEVDDSFDIIVQYESGSAAISPGNRNIFRTIANANNGLPEDQQEPCKILEEKRLQILSKLADTIMLLYPELKELAVKDSVSESDLSGLDKHPARLFESTLYELTVDKGIKVDPEQSRPSQKRRALIEALKLKAA